MAEQQYHQPSVYSLFVIQAAAAIFLMIALLNLQLDLVFLMLLILVIMTGARLWSRSSLNRVAVHAGADRQRLFPDDRIQVTVRIENKKWLPIRLRLGMSVSGGLLHEKDGGLERECGLLWHQGSVFRWTLRACRRGVYSLGEVQLTSGDFFGFYLNSKKIEAAPVEIVVFPRIRPARAFAFPRKDFLGPAAAKSPVQDPVYILGTRDYDGRQPARYIHWKAGARCGRLQEKVFGTSAQAKILFLVDAASFARHDAREDFERTLEAAASLALQGDQKGVAFGLLTNAAAAGRVDRVPISRGPRHISAFLEALARLKMQARRPLSESLLKSGAMPWGVSAVCFCYEVCEDICDVEQLCMRRRLSASFILCKAPAAEKTRRMTGRMTLDDIFAEAPPS